MTPWQSIRRSLKARLSFPEILISKFQLLTGYRNAKSLVKHLLVADVTKRYGCLKNGANDIKNHRWFKSLDWYKLSQKKNPAPYMPQIAKAGDTSNFSEYPDSDTMSPEVSKKDDPFLEW